jgi:hypothetical protein
MRSAVWSPLESTAVRVSAKVDIVDAPARQTVSVSMRIDPATVSFTHERDRWKAELDLVYVQKTAEGQQSGEGIADRISLALTDQTYARVMKDGIVAARTFPRHPTAATLRMVVRDADTGSTGSVTVPFSEIGARE